MGFINQMVRANKRMVADVRREERAINTINLHEQKIMEELVLAAKYAFNSLNSSKKQIEGNKKALEFMERHQSPTRAYSALYLFNAVDVFNLNDFYFGLTKANGPNTLIESVCGPDCLMPRNFLLNYHDTARNEFIYIVTKATLHAQEHRERQIEFLRQVTPDEVGVRLERLAKTGYVDDGMRIIQL